MTTANPALRALLVYAVVLPLALVLGYLLATPNDYSTVAMIGLVLAVLLSPLLLKYHHPLLFITWNSSAVAFFMPGRPGMWLPMAFVSMLISIVERTLVREKRFIHEPMLFWPLVFLTTVVAVTGHFTGGMFGMASLGSATLGGRRSLNIFAAIVGFFAMTSVRIPPRKALLYMGLFFLPALVNMVTSIIVRLQGPLLYLAIIFPISNQEATGTEMGTGLGHQAGIARLEGLTTTCQCLSAYLLARYGLRELLTGRKLWLTVLVPTLILLGGMGGFRSFIAFQILLFLGLFCFEGLYRTKYLVPMVFGVVLGGIVMFTQAERLPLSIQRSISFLPIPVDERALTEAEGTKQWRIDMWKAASLQIPRYFWLGRGLSIDAESYRIAAMTSQGVKDFDQQGILTSSDFHNGPLTILIPFGIWGMLAWLWFLAASIRALYLNHLYGDPDLQKLNTFLLAFFIGRVIFQFTVFGNFYTDIPAFTGLLGLGIALNGGICKPARIAMPAPGTLPFRKDHAPLRPSASFSR
jgi:hypothetical protein